MNKLAHSAVIALFGTFVFVSACGNDNAKPKDKTKSVCGNGSCEAGEDNTNCAMDCSTTCPNGTCDAGETELTCPADCASSNGGGDTCDLITAGTNIGGTCSAQDDPTCGEGFCAQFTGDAGPSCYQKCVSGECEDKCGTDEVCLTVKDQATGNTIELAPGVDMGVCTVMPTGDAGAYDSCGSEACQAGMACGGLTATTGMCFPPCNAGTPPTCDDFEGFAAQCGIPIGSNSYCAIPCTPDCPTGMTCDTGTDRNFCIPN